MGNENDRAVFAGKIAAFIMDEELTQRAQRRHRESQRFNSPC